MQIKKPSRDMNEPYSDNTTEPTEGMSTTEYQDLQIMSRRLDDIQEEMKVIREIIPSMTIDIIHLMQTDSMIIAENMDKLKHTFNQISTESEWEEIRRLEHYEGPEAAFQYTKRLFEKAGQDARTGSILITMLNTAMEIQQDKIKYLFESANK